MSIYDASMKYQKAGVPLVIIAGQEYGTGSSRDWAAKGTRLLGVKAVIAQSFERIHRSNLVGMGVLPLCFADGVNAQTLKLDGTEVYSLRGLTDDIKPRQIVLLEILRADGRSTPSRSCCASTRRSRSTTISTAESSRTSCGRSSARRRDRSRVARVGRRSC